MLIRSLLVLCCLATVLPAAPAPLARRQKEPSEGRWWSAPIDGIRVRLVATKTRYRVGETIRLDMEIQNVSSSSVTLDDADLAGSVSTGDYRPDGWSITGRRTDRSERGVEQLKKLVDQMKRASASCKLAPGQSMRFEIHVDGAAQKAGEGKEGDDRPHRVGIYFDEAETPGIYEFRAIFSRGSGDRVQKQARKNGWAGYGLKSPAVRIEIVE